MADPAIQDKLYFKIGEVSQLTGLPGHVLRFWESEFPALRPKRTNSGQRLYRKKEIELIRTIQYLLHERKFTISGANQYLRRQSKSNPEKTEVDLIEDITRELKSIRKLLD
jgi:DNA-binding transcriptional MerR regulator